MEECSPLWVCIILITSSGVPGRAYFFLEPLLTLIFQHQGQGAIPPRKFESSYDHIYFFFFSPFNYVSILFLS